jgi:hypothetical protein
MGKLGYWLDTRQAIPDFDQALRASALLRINPPQRFVIQFPLVDGLLSKTDDLPVC